MARPRAPASPRGGPIWCCSTSRCPSRAASGCSRRLREAQDHVPVIVLSARQDEFEKVAALRLGADDYVTKPFALAELLARVDAVLRRARLSGAPPRRRKPAPPSTRRNRRPERRAALRRRRSSISPAAPVIRGGQLVKLTHLEFELLSFFCRNSRPVFSREELVREVWGLRQAARRAPSTTSWRSCAPSWNRTPTGRATCSPCAAAATASRPSEATPPRRPAVQRRISTAGSTATAVVRQLTSPETAGLRRTTTARGSWRSAATSSRGSSSAEQSATAGPVVCTARRIASKRMAALDASTCNQAEARSGRRAPAGSAAIDVDRVVDADAERDRERDEVGEVDVDRRRQHRGESQPTPTTSDPTHEPKCRPRETEQDQHRDRDGTRSTLAIGPWSCTARSRRIDDKTSAERGSEPATRAALPSAGLVAPRCEVLSR